MTEAKSTAGILPVPRRYTGTKTLKAWPRTLGQYNAYRQWDMPDGEDPAKPGYMVEYEDGGDPNDVRHSGYISWSPSDVFERAYMPSDTPYERLLIEGDEVSRRLHKLRDFMTQPGFKELPPEDRNLLGAQATAMGAYLDVLAKRRVRMDPDRERQNYGAQAEAEAVVQAARDE